MIQVLDFLKYAGDLLSGAQHIYWGLALGGTLVLFILMIMTFFGVSGDHGDAMSDSFGEHSDTGFSDFKLFSFRAVLAFITFFGWGGVLWGHHGWGGFLGAFALGFSMMFATAALLCVMMRLQQSGNLRVQDIVGATGTVYIGIPAGRTESGKVTVSLKDRTLEITAVSDEDIPSGSAVTIEAKINGQRFLVKKN
ncbi:MAG: hypothetical protein A2X49_04770 [Lentisphaerae bacterium GWF2_52_8]|nr:MAG: hypothetical protein A2X49_04770 [Lentisphaerae bacterium GWF2_52_8]